jgi:NADH dehydrogenase
MSSETDAEIVVLGASFAGIELVHRLLRAFDGKPPRIVVVDRQAEHGYLPLVQERLCGVLDPAASRLNTRAFVESVPGARYLQGEVVSLDPANKVTTLADGTTVRGRFVVVALGSAFEAPAGIEGAEQVVAYKGEASFERARDILARTLTGLEQPEVVVIGGGISGCELAGELAALTKARPSGWAAPKVRLVASSPALVQGLGPSVSRKALGALQAQGVAVDVSTRLVAVRDGEVELKAGAQVRVEPAHLVLWAGGVKPAPILASLGLPRTDDGWLAVGPSLQCFVEETLSQPDIFACGDAVRVVGGDGRWATMQRAIECIWQAQRVAKSIATLHAEPEDYPDGVPPMTPHTLREDFFYGLSLGARSLVAYRGFSLDLPGINHRFRRWLMRQYFSRYAPLPTG